jgi:hypothetical protein
MKHYLIVIAHILFITIPRDILVLLLTVEQLVDLVGPTLLYFPKPSLLLMSLALQTIL